MLNQEDLKVFLGELYQTANLIVKLEAEVEIIKEGFDNLYVNDPRNEEEFMNLRAKLAKIRLMLTEGDV